MTTRKEESGVLLALTLMDVKETGPSSSEKLCSKGEEARRGLFTVCQ